MHKLVPTATIEAGNFAMTSLEIAEITEKRHDNVMRDIKRMLEDCELDALKFEGVRKDAKGEYRHCYHLPKDLVITLIAGYSAPLRLKIVRRLDELEREKQAGTLSLPKGG
jgi:phage regulator Rha-like protein